MRVRRRRLPTSAGTPFACAVATAAAAAAATAFAAAGTAPALQRPCSRRPAQRAGHLRRRASGDAPDGAAEDPEQPEADTTNVDLFRQSLIRGWGGGEIGGGDSRSDWARPLPPGEVRAGDVLLGAPRGFLGEGPGAGPRRVGLRGRIPEDWPQRERLRIMPVVLLTQVAANSGAAEGVVLTLRTGQLMGDFVNHFHSRPLHYGGPDEASLTMVHPYPQVPKATLLSEETGLYVGGDFEGAQAWVEEGQGSSLRFRFFLNRVRWSPGELAAEAGGGGGDPTWLPVRCSADLVLAEANSMEDRPLWAQIAELAGGAVEEAARRHGLLD